MGKISDALKKIQAERERERKLQQKKLIDEVVVQDDDKDTRQSTAHSGKADTVFRRTPSISVDTPLADKPASYKEVPSTIFNRLLPFLGMGPGTYIARAKDSSGIDPRIVTYYDYSSTIAEQYRTLRTNLKSHILTRVKSSSRIASNRSLTEPKFITVTSSFNGEGKSVTCVNLAVALAKDLDSKVLIIDADLRNGSVHKLLNIDSTPGLSDVLLKDLDYSVALHSTLIKNLFVIPSGKTPPNPAELLGSKKMRLILEELRSEPVSYILIDTPPVLPFADAGILATNTDGVLLVVQAYRTNARAVQKARELLEHAHSKLLGFVLTQSDFYDSGYYDYYYQYSYRYGKDNSNVYKKKGTDNGRSTT